MSGEGAPRSGWDSPSDLLVLHAVRVAGVANDAALAEHTGLDERVVGELVEDDRARGWVSRVDFAGTGGWTLTQAGRDQDTASLAEELNAAGARGAVEAARQGCEPLNARLVRACTAWQLRPQGGDPLAANDHTNPRWDAEVLDQLSAVEVDLGPLVAGLSAALSRFAGYDARFASALARARAGDQHAVAGLGATSCHGVWMELHEDLLSTLGLDRTAQPGRG